MIGELDVHLPRLNPARIRTDEDTVELVRRLAVHYTDGVIAGILNRQGRKTVRGERFTANQVGSLRRYRHIARFDPPAEPPSLCSRFSPNAHHHGLLPQQLGVVW